MLRTMLVHLDWPVSGTISEIVDALVTPQLGNNLVTNEESVRGLARRLAEAIPQNIRTAGEDIERNFRTVLRSGLGKMNLVSREEFDVQAAVLARTRQRLEALEAQLAELEQQTD